MNFLIALITGLAAGLHNSTWGMYKDSPHEGFTWPKYFRSAIAGLIYGPLVWYFFDLDLSKAANILVLFGATYLCERLTMEVYKTFIRREDQSKYFIPMQLSVFGKPVKSYGARLVVGFFYVLIVVLVGIAVYNLNKAYHAGSLNWNPYLILLICSVGGWISAFGGAWKDAPVEGFETFKFFRSPGVAYFFAFIAALFTNNIMLITMCSIGFTVATIETYKTFFFPSRPRGKFAGKPILFPEWETKRQKFLPLYIAIWIFVIVMAILGIVNGAEGLINF
jgi:hypothetical protein